MNTTLKVAAAVAGTLLMLAVGGVGYAIATGLSARPAPGALETRLARAVRRLAVPRDMRGRTNPFASDAEATTQGRNHYARHCPRATRTTAAATRRWVRGCFRESPDMRQASTQDLSDGELFYIIEHGVRFTGMAAWGDGSQTGEDLGWKLVGFIRQLPKLTAEDLAEMKDLNP